MAHLTPYNTTKVSAMGSKRVNAPKLTHAQKKQATSNAAKRAKKRAMTARMSNRSKSTSDNSQETPTHQNNGDRQHHAILYPSSVVNNTQASNTMMNSDMTDINMTGMEIETDEDPATEVMRLKAQLAEALEQVKAVTAAGAGQGNPAEAIQELKKPKGEAGDKKQGFILKQAIGLEDDVAMYKKIMMRARVKTNTIKAGINFKHEYKNQNKETLGKVFKVSHTVMPNDTDHEKEFAAYLTQKCFPVDWAQAKIVKQFIQNNQKHARKNGHLPKVGSDTEEEPEDEFLNVDVEAANY
ncbi:hypothetical protein IW261DRAFT_1576762 [Armillaria novae-zelandiae]|uniref:Uncharacterized protein n=1 Tax=Armillaria novae-zelandiae TaxID=153914 RepID=A0AA39N9N1_9AGAR|nr:hypothetical protein IW261DRAFT_1576762 [Armillaria novae-zelandiae]